MEKFHAPFVVLNLKNFRYHLIALLVGQIGSQMQTVAINWQMYQLTKSALYLGFIGLVGFLPILLFSLIGGTLVDILDRKIIYMVSQATLAVSAAILASSTVFHVVNPFILYLVLAINSLVATVVLPARQSIVPALVPQKYFVNAISMVNIAWQMSIVIGPTIGGFLIALYGVRSVYVLNVFSAVLATCLIFFISLPKAEGVTKKVTLDYQSIKEGIKFVAKTPLIYSTMLLDFFATFFASASTLMPIFAIDVLHVGPQGVGLLYAAPAAGAILAGIILSLHTKLHNQGKMLVISVIIYGLATVGFGFSKIFLLSLFALAATGVADTVSAVIRNTARQILTPDHLRGRMTAINMNFFVGGPFLGELEAGFTAAWWGAPLSVVVGGVATALFTVIVALGVPKLRNYSGAELTD